MTGPAAFLRAALAVALVLAAAAGEAATLVVAGSTDTEAMAPLIDRFEAENPDVAVRYLELGTLEIYDGTRSGTITPAPDVLISSAADLQVRLVNDGFALTHASAATQRLPAWARWRDEAFGFTFEPLVFVVNPTLLPPEAWPRTRDALGRLVAIGGVDGPRVATYDVGTSGIGYLAASTDAALMSDYWPFVERISGSGLLTACCTADVLDMVEDGRALVGYNVLGSYARARLAGSRRLAIVEPEDFTVAITRVAIILSTAREPGAARRFLDFLLSDGAQALLGDDALLPAPAGARSGGPVRPVPLDATLLALTDDMRRRQFIALWSSVASGGP
jgi:two-component system sensor histidine kinase TctE